MKRLIISTAFTLTIIILYQFIDINLFAIDLPRRVSAELFKSLRTDPGVETEIVLLDIEYIDLDTVKTYIELLESFEPKSIGVNLCNIEDTSEILNKYLSESKNIITCDCDKNSNKRTSGILTPKNEITHFKTDKNSYFELQLSDNLNGLKERGNNKERINFRGTDRYFRAPLSEIENIVPEVLKDKTILIGFLRDSLVTPMNYWYGRPGDNIGDMSDAQISANIISTINRNEFINEVNPLFRVLIILAAGLLCTVLIRLVRTKYNVVNFLLGLVILIVLNGLSSYIIVFAFSENYYLELNEVTVVLIISAIVSIYWNTKSRQGTSLQQSL
ncbi:CHASE2 domain-containing protein [Ohtaekwangia koreensis]|uniref:CHASE2 domain-containing protein n=1 Tax=Ohtaekwangia koreensis TaxID=688867 RepID=A0A1T5IY93_9BACT|nr:CHASE2 domain-containing protein [Ohtaekwangia koreensis]SKC43898.1 CHASE2 domain-containing protein [Ohtaekwangia koreensis]